MNHDKQTKQKTHQPDCYITNKKTRKLKKEKRPYFVIVTTFEIELTRHILTLKIGIRGAHSVLGPVVARFVSSCGSRFDFIVSFLILNMHSRFNLYFLIITFF